MLTKYVHNTVHNHIVIFLPVHLYWMQKQTLVQQWIDIRFKCSQNILTFIAYIMQPIVNIITRITLIVESSIRMFIDYFKQRYRVVKDPIPPKEIQCLCCFNSIAITKSIVCSKSDTHASCNECMIAYIEESINNMTSIVCMMKHIKCEGLYDESVIVTLMKPHIKATYDLMRSIHATREKHIVTPNSFICPVCQRYLLILRDDEKRTHFVCDICSNPFCIKCNNQALVCVCSNINTMSEDMIKQIIGAIIDKIIIHKCPACSSKYIKEDGCNLMTCSNCHAYSCWSCGIQVFPINGKKYQHFKGSGSADKNAVCPLYGDDVFFKTMNDKVKMELQKFLKACDNQKLVKKIIRSELRVRDIVIPSSFKSSFCTIV